LQPIVGNYFRNSAQDYTVLDFLSARSQRQVEAAEHIRAAIGAYDVQAIDTLIGDINPPATLMETQTDRKIAEEQRKTYEVQEAAQKQRQQLVRQTSLADIQQQVVGAEQGVNIAELKANANVKQATGDAEATRLRALGGAEARAPERGVYAPSPRKFTGACICYSQISFGNRSSQRRHRDVCNSEQQAWLSRSGFGLLFRRRVVEQAELRDEVFDGGGVKRLRVFGRENAEANAIVAPGAVEEGMLVNPTGAFVGEEVDFEHLKCVAHATQGVVQGLCRKVGRPGLGERSFVRIADAAREDAGKLSPAGEPLLEYFLHACRVNFPPATGWRSQTARGRAPSG